MNDTIAKTRMIRAVKAIELYRRSLDEAAASNEIIRDLASICRYLKMSSTEEATTILKGVKNQKSKMAQIEFNYDANLLLVDVFKILTNEKVSRRELEALAIGRFGVPRGSLSSFSNLEMLREKIATLAFNEQAHETISDVARHTRS